VGEPAEEMYAMTKVFVKILPEGQTQILNGGGYCPINILETYCFGNRHVDLCMPTRNARNGMLFYSTCTINNKKNKKWEDDFSPVTKMG